MKLIHKGLIFLASVLVLQMVAFVGLTSLLLKSEGERAKAEQARVVVSSLLDIDHRLHGASVTLMLLGASKSKGKLLQHFDQLCAEIPSEVQALKNNPVLSRQEQSSLLSIERGANFLIALMVDCKTALEQDSFGLKVIRSKMTFENEILPQLADLNTAIEALADKQRAVQETVAQGHSLELIKMALLGIFVVNVATMVCLVVGFMNGVTTRLSLIADNIARLAKGQMLNQTMSGSDEIVLVDRTFHDLAQALTDAAEKDKAVFRHMPLGLITCGAGGKIESINPAAEAMLGQSPEQMFDRAFVSILQNDQSDFVNLIADSQSAPSRYLIKREDGKSVPTEMSLAHFRLKGEDRYVVCAADITEREYAEKLRAEIISVVSHDLKTPLSSIACFLDLIDIDYYGDLPPNLNKDADNAARECKRIMRLTADLLDAAALEAGSIKLARRRIELSCVFERALDAVARVAEQNEIELSAQDQGVHVWADEDRLVQILINLLVNAIKFSPKGEGVSLSIEKHEPGWKLCVNDRGRGVPDEMKAKIFERFEQVREQDAKIGTGLGLAICKLLAESHGGSVGVDDRPGGGSIFWVLLPPGGGES